MNAMGCAAVVKWCCTTPDDSWWVVTFISKVLAVSLPAAAFRCKACITTVCTHAEKELDAHRSV